MASVTIDAGVLAAPPAGSARQDAEQYVQTLLDWSKLLDEPWVAIYMSERASEVLYEDGLYPLREALKALFAASGIVEYDVNTIATVVDRLLQITPSFETYFSIQDVLTEDLTTEPDILKLCAGAQLQSDLARCIVLIAILRHHCHETIDHSVILRRAPGNTVRVRALIHDLEHDRKDLERTPEPPQYFEGDVLVCDDFRGLINALDAAAILERATDSVGIETAIQVAIYKSRADAGETPDWDELPQFRVGLAFGESLQRIQLNRVAEDVLRAIVETIEQTNMRATHSLRTGAGGGNPQRVRSSDGARAWRRDIDREYHLHYWVCTGNLVELARVSFPHDDFSIPE